MSIDKQQKVEILRNKTGIGDFNSVSKPDFENLQKMIGKNSLTQDELSLLIELIPNFIDLQKEYIEGVKEISKSASASQKSAFDVLDRSMAILEKLLNTEPTDEIKSQIIETIKDIAKTIKEMNESNNSFFKGLAQVAMGVVAAVGTIFFIKDKFK